MSGPLRWLFVGTFTAAPCGVRTTLSGERLGDVMARLAPRVNVTIPDRIGTGSTRIVQLRLDRPRSLRVQDLCEETEPLAELRSIAQALTRATNPLAPDEALRQLRALLGSSPLVLALEGLARDEASTEKSAAESARSEPEQPPEPASQAHSPADAEAPAEDVLDSIFAKAALPNRADVVQAAKSGLDQFIGALRGDAPTPTPSTRDGLAARMAALLLDNCEATIVSALADPQAATIEACWRGAKFVLSESPGHGELAIEILDVEDDQRVDQIRRALEGTTGPVPDSVFILTPIERPTDLEDLGEMAEMACVPVVVPLDPNLLDDDDQAHPLKRWNALRKPSKMGWICTCSNDVVLANETTRLGARVVFGAPVLAIAAMLTAALRRNHTFLDAFGRAGAVTSPASHEVEDARGSTQPLPTRAGLSVDAQRAMAEYGITVVGHERDGARLIALGAPMLGTEDGPHLVGRILVGRAVRAALHARDELPLNPPPKALADAFAKAGSSILPEAPPGTCELRAEPRGERLHVAAEFSGLAAGRLFSFDFAL